MYYNTTNETGSKLNTAWIETAKQDEIIFEVFNKHQETFYTPFNIQDILSDNYIIDYPITSIRRALNTLTNDGKIIKTPIKRKGLYGKSNYTWRYKND